MNADPDPEKFLKINADQTVKASLLKRIEIGITAVKSNILKGYNIKYREMDQQHLCCFSLRHR